MVDNDNTRINMYYIDKGNLSSIATGYGAITLTISGSTLTITNPNTTYAAGYELIQLD